MNTEQIVQHLQHHDVRPTALRIMIWRTLLSFDYAFALGDLEGVLPTVDRSTLFRALTLFAQHDLLHPLDDGSGQQKYCVCDADDDTCLCQDCAPSVAATDGMEHDTHHHHHAQCEHVHLTCVKCGHTYCLKNKQIPQVEVPEGFRILHVQYVIQGICPRCTHWKPKA